MDDLKPIRIFLAVAEHLSFAQAARALRMTPATVTRSVAQLEQMLGQQLFVRTTRQVSLTAAGARVAARFTPLMQEIGRATDEIIGASRPDLGRLRINAPLSLGVRVLPDLIQSFRLAYPRIDLQVHLTDVLVDIIAEDCDLAIRVSRPPRDKSTIWQKICEVPRYLVAAPALFDHVPLPRQPEDIDPRLMLSYGDAGEPELWELSHGAQRRVLKSAGVVTSNNGDFLYGVARAGGGICLLPDFLVQDGLARGEVTRLLPDWDLPSLWLTLFYPPYDTLPPLVATFAEFFEDYMTDQDRL